MRHRNRLTFRATLGRQAPSRNLSKYTVRVGIAPAIPEIMTNTNLDHALSHLVTTLCYLILAAALAIALTGCGALTDPPPNMPVRWVQGVGIMVEDGAPAWTADDAATLDAIRIGAEHVGGTLDDLQGWIVVFRAPATQNTSCDSPDQHQISRGCEHDSGWIDIVTYVPETLSTDNVAVSVYQTALIHEVAHVIIHDPCHRDASWMDFETASQATPQHWLNPPWIWESEPTC